MSADLVGPDEDVARGGGAGSGPLWEKVFAWSGLVFAVL